MEFPHQAIPSAAFVHGPLLKITVEETEGALKKMKHEQGDRPNDLAADLRKSKLWYPANWLAKSIIPRKCSSTIECIMVYYFIEF